MLAPSTEVLTCWRGSTCRVPVFCDGPGPPAVEGLACRTCTCEYGERRPVEGAATWLESFEAVERLDSLRSEDCDNDDCDLWPEGECGLGGGRRGGRLLLAMVELEKAVLLVKCAAGRGLWLL